MNNIAKISVQRFVVSGDVVNSITAYDERGFRIGRQQQIYQDKELTDDEVKAAVSASKETPVNRETLSPAVAGKW